MRTFSEGLRGPLVSANGQLVSHASHNKEMALKHTYPSECYLGLCKLKQGNKNQHQKSKTEPTAKENNRHCYQEILLEIT